MTNGGDIRAWLAELDLAKYAEVFSSNAIDLDVVRELDAAYGTLLRERRRALHARIAETLEGQFAEIAESQPELLAHHWTEAGLIEKAAGLWGKAGHRSLARSALVEAIAQLNRALTQIATLPGTPAQRRERIKLQVALANALMPKVMRRPIPRPPSVRRVC
jgi:predicted ATPase